MGNDDLSTQAAQGALYGRNLVEYVDTRNLAVDHAMNRRDLTFNPPQTFESVGFFSACEHR